MKGGTSLYHDLLVRIRSPGPYEISHGLSSTMIQHSLVS